MKRVSSSTYLLPQGVSSQINGTDLEEAESTGTAASNDSDIRADSVKRQNNDFNHPLSVIVDFDGQHDPYQPLNWPFRRKVVTTLLYGLTTMGSSWASSVYSPVAKQISEEFDVDIGQSLGGISIMVLGFGLGPLIFAPLSEVYGRKPAIVIPYLIAIIFCFSTGAAKDIQTVIITRFFAGVFGSAPITVTGGVLSDIWSAKELGTAISLYAFTVLCGAMLGPIAGGAIAQSSLWWRWTQYLTAGVMMILFVLDSLILHESYPPILLVYKARKLRYKTGNWALHARFEEWDFSPKEMLVTFGIRPLRMLLTPICFLVALYASLVYGILYASLGAFPIAFEERGWDQFFRTLPFLAVLIGMIIGTATNILNQKFYTRQYIANNNVAVPEARLPPMMVGSVFFAGGLFLFGWTSDRSMPWILPCCGAAMMGIGFLTIFQSSLSYLIDTFHTYAASAVAANTFFRSVLGAAFPLLVKPMYHSLGVPWATSLLGFLAVALISIPYLFYSYGKRLRTQGRYSGDAE